MFPFKKKVQAPAQPTSREKVRDMLDICNDRLNEALRKARERLAERERRNAPHAHAGGK